MKKLWDNFIFRNAVMLAVIALTAVAPLAFALPTLSSTSSQIALSIAVLCLLAIEGALYLWIEYRMTIAPVRSLQDAARKLSHGAYDTKANVPVGDASVKRLAKATDALGEEFRNLEQMRKSFVANASHELRSPLTSMQGFVQAILDGTVAEEDRNKYLQIVLNETKRLNALITSMLDLSRIESGKSPLSPSRFEIGTVIRGVVERFEPNLVKKTMQIDVDFCEESTYVYADKEKIVQVLVNLIDNAVKYSPAYSRISVTTRRRADKIYVTVKDQGAGIGKRDQALIWDKFYMADKARTPNSGKGSGLGLCIVKQIIDDHRETICVESNAGAGATFVFTLTPYEAAHIVERKNAD